MTAKYEELTGVTVQPGSPERLFIQWAASVIIQERVLANSAANQNIPSRAEGKNLDALAELFYTKERPGATAAACTMRFNISEAQEFAVLIPKGTRVTDAGNTLVWATEKDVFVSAGTTGAEVTARCQTEGRAGNGFAVGQIDTIVDLFPYYLNCKNLTESDGGRDEATDEEFYELMRASMDSYSCAGARGSYEYFAKQVSPDIADVVSNSPSPGVVKIYVLMKDGTLAGAQLKSDVLAACSDDENRPMTDHVLMADAEIVSYDIKFTYYLQNGCEKSAAEIAAAVQEAVEQYKAWQCAKMGRDINQDKLRDYLYHTGVKRIVLTAPAFTKLRNGKDGSVPQVARAGTVTITSGGYEDE